MATEEAKSSILIAIGANMAGPRGEAPLETCRMALTLFPEYGIAVEACSRWYRSPAYPEGAGPEFVNAVIRVGTNLSPGELLARLHRLEARFGRRRSVPNAPRPLDLDLIDYRGLILVTEGGLRLPHPRLHQRAFVLLPLSEVAPDWHHPSSGMPVKTLIERLEAAQKAWPLNESKEDG